MKMFSYLWFNVFTSLSLLTMANTTPIRMYNRYVLLNLYILFSLDAVPTSNISSRILLDETSNYFENQFYRFSIRKPDNWHRLNNSIESSSTYFIFTKNQSRDGAHIEGVVRQANSLLTCANQCHEIDINGQKFFAHYSAKQIQYVKQLHHDYFLIITIVYESEEEKQELDKILRTLTFFTALKK